jgi:hypothetical protein
VAEVAVLIEPGDYLTDGKNLFRVDRIAQDGTVLLENARTLDYVFLDPAEALRLDKVERK